jgi:hypothetical protein
MAKLLESHGIKIEDREVPVPELPDDLKKACRAAKVQENRTLRALELVLEKWDTPESYRVVSRILRTAESDADRFQGCS